MRIYLPFRSIATVTALTLGLAACEDSGGTSTTADATSTGDTTTATDTSTGGDSSTGGDTSTGSSTTYKPFQQSNLENQLIRVAAHTAIAKLRKDAAFKAEDFGEGCGKWNPATKSPSDPKKFGSLYVESASLAEKVQGRKDAHAYNKGAEIGKEIDAFICAGIDAGGKSGATPRDTYGSIDWQAQIVDKSLLRFYYESIYHYMVDGSRKGYDEGVGYYGMSLDGAEAFGLAATVKSRDGNCGTTYGKDVWKLLIDGKAKLDAALTAEGKAGNEEKLATLTADLKANAQEIDTKLTEVLALSMGREMMGIKKGDKPAIKLIEGRMFFEMLKARIADHDKQKGTTYGTQIGGNLTQTDPAKVKPDEVLAAIKAIWGLDVEGLCKN